MGWRARVGGEVWWLWVGVGGGFGEDPFVRSGVIGRLSWGGVQWARVAPGDSTGSSARKLKQYFSEQLHLDNSLFLDA